MRQYAYPGTARAAFTAHRWRGGGCPAAVPKSHRARRAIVKRHFPRLAETYDGLYTLGLTARYYNGYVMAKKTWRKAAQCHGILSKAIPVQRAGRQPPT